MNPPSLASPTAFSSPARAARLFAALATLALAGLAIWVRLRALGYTEFGGDQSLSLNMALEWVHGGPLPLASLKSSLGVYNFPLVEYLWALPLLFKPDVFGVVWLIALVNLAGLGVAAWATARVFGWRVAWWAALLFAVNPWAVYYGRLIWMQTLVPGFASIFFACVLLYFTDQPKALYLIAGALSLSAVIQSHPTAAVLGLLVVILGFCFPRRLKFKPLLIGAGLFLLSVLPFAIFEVRHNFVDWYTLRAGLSQPAEISLAPLNLMLELLQSKRIYDTLGSASALWQALDLAWPVDTLIAGLLGLTAGWSLVAVIAQVWQSRAHRTPWAPRRVGQFILLLWLGVPILFYLRHNYPLQNYYFLYLYPAPFVLLALLADRVYAWLRPQVARWLAAWPASLKLIFSQGLAAVAFLPLALIGFQQLRLDLYGQALQMAGLSGHQRIVDTQRAIDTARQLLNAQPECKLVVMSEADEYGYSRLSLLREFTRPSPATDVDRVRFVAAGAGNLVPSPCAFYLLITPNPAAQAWLAAYTRPLPDATLHTPEETWTFYALSAAQRAQNFGRFKDAAPLGEWNNGLQLKHAQIEGALNAGGSLTVTNWWAVMQPASSRPVHFGTYLLTADSRLITQADGVGVDSAQWQPGDLFQTVFSLALPADLQPGRYALAQALYFYPEVERIPLAQPAGDLFWLDKVTLASPTP